MTSKKLILIKLEPKKTSDPAKNKFKEPANNNSTHTLLEIRITFSQN